MTKKDRQAQSFEACLREYSEQLHSGHVVKNGQLLQKSENDEHIQFAVGYVSGLSEALTLLQSLAAKHHIPLHELGLETISIEDIRAMVDVGRKNDI